MTPAELVASAEAVILDFDGPMCDVFANQSAERLAEILRREVSGRPISESAAVAGNDPLAILAEVAQRSPEQAFSLSSVMTEYELRAVDSSPATRGLPQLLECLSVGQRKPIAIASNNSPEAISEWLTAQRLDNYIEHVEGRDQHNLNRMKPSPFMLLAVARRFGVPVGDCVFVGDALSDAVAADSAAMPFVGYANKPGKKAAFEARGQAILTESMSVLCSWGTSY